MSQMVNKFDVFDVCLPIVIGVGIVFALVTNVVLFSAPPEIRDYQKSAQVENSLAEA